MTTILLYHLACTAIALAVLYPLVVFLLWISRPSSARLYRFAWSGVLVIPFFALSLPVVVPVAQEDSREVGNRPPGDCVGDSRPEAVIVVTNENAGYSAEYRTLSPGGRQPTYSPQQPIETGNYYAATLSTGDTVAGSLPVFLFLH